MYQSEQVHIFATIRAETGKADELRPVLVRLVTAAKAEPGNLHYILHEDPETVGSFYFFEAYKDEAAVDAHMNSAHFKAAGEQMRTLIDTKPNITKTKPIAGS